MLSYAALDRIADAHNPILGLFWILLIGNALRERRTRVARRRAASGLGSLVVAYGLEYVDVATGLWPRFGLDYSTHTAVAVAMVATLATCARAAGVFALATFALYAPLMVHQGYHRAEDIASTALAVLLFIGMPAWRGLRGDAAARTVLRDPQPEAASRASPHAGSTQR